MSGQLLDAGDFASEMVAGQCVVVAALVIALHEKGIMPRGAYCDALRRLWTDMPEDEAIGEAGAVIERVLDFLTAQALVLQPQQRCGNKSKMDADAGERNSGNALR